MANEIEGRFHLGVKVAVSGAGVPSIQARTAAVSSLANPGPGIFRIVFNPGIAAAEEVHAMCTEVIELEEGFLATSGRCNRISDTEYEVLTFDNAGVAANAGFSFVIYRVSSSNGT